MTNSKPRVIIMTKIDLCDMDKTNGWIKYYEDKESISDEVLNQIFSALKELENISGK